MTGRGPRWRITSDGTPAGTRVHLGDVDVSHAVRSVTFRLPDPNGLAEVDLELSGYLVDLDVEAPRADVTVAECPVCEAGIRCDAHPDPCRMRHAVGSNVRCTLPDRHKGDHDDGTGNTWSSCCDDTPGHEGHCSWRVS